jgi:hypothetical protein
LGFHRWHLTHNDIGEPRLVCVRCGKEDEAGGQYINMSG